MPFLTIHDGWWTDHCVKFRKGSTQSPIYEDIKWASSSKRILYKEFPMTKKRVWWAGLSDTILKGAPKINIPSTFGSNAVFFVAMEDTNPSELFIVWEAPTFFSTLIVWVCLLSFTHSSVCVLTNHWFVFNFC